VGTVEKQKRRPTQKADRIRALFGAMFTYGRLTLLLLEETGKDVAAFDEFYERQLKTLRNLAPSKRHLIQRNDQCPCGSGRKYKNCHGG
jgi:hypothetical protein